MKTTATTSIECLDKLHTHRPHAAVVLILLRRSRRSPTRTHLGSKGRARPGPSSLSRRWRLARANAGAFCKVSKCRCWRVKPPSAARQGGRQPAEASERCGAEKSGPGARAMAPTPWRGRHRRRQKETRVSFRDAQSFSGPFTTPETPRPRCRSASS